MKIINYVRPAAIHQEGRNGDAADVSIDCSLDVTEEDRNSKTRVMARRIRGEPVARGGQGKIGP
jgi:hypothetical protein